MGAVFWKIFPLVVIFAQISAFSAPGYREALKVSIPQDLYHMSIPEEPNPQTLAFLVTQLDKTWTAMWLSADGELHSLNTSDVKFWSVSDRSGNVAWWIHEDGKMSKYDVRDDTWVTVSCNECGYSIFSVSVAVLDATEEFLYTFAAPGDSSYVVHLRKHNASDMALLSQIMLSDIEDEFQDYHRNMKIVLNGESLYFTNSLLGGPKLVEVDISGVVPVVTRNFTSEDLNVCEMASMGLISSDTVMAVCGVSGAIQIFNVTTWTSQGIFFPFPGSAVIPSLVALDRSGTLVHIIQIGFTELKSIDVSNATDIHFTAADPFSISGVGNLLPANVDNTVVAIQLRTITWLSFGGDVSATEADRGTSSLSDNSGVTIAVAVTVTVVVVAMTLLALLALLFLRRRQWKVNSNQWEIDFSDLAIDKELGTGTYGTDYLALWREAPCLAKKLNVDPKCEESVGALTKLRPHPNLLSFFGKSAGNGHLWTVMEYISNGSLCTNVCLGKLKLDRHAIICIAHDITSGMLHLHREGIIHGALDTQSVLVERRSSSSITVKLSEFGFSGTSHMCKKNWTAPEVMDSKVSTMAGDVWSFGMVLCVLGGALKRSAEPMHASGHPCVPPSSIPESNFLWELVEKCLKKEKERASFEVLSQDLEKMEAEEEFEMVEAVSPSTTSSAQPIVKNEYVPVVRNEYEPGRSIMLKGGGEDEEGLYNA